ncbi:hypothetical protein UZY92_22435, partial [Escherichia coli]|nr:hypothetical protein [Escherichia coli]
MRRYASYHADKTALTRRPDKAFTPHPAVVHRCQMRRYASYHADKTALTRRPDKAVTPHPAVVHR